MWPKFNKFLWLVESKFVPKKLQTFSSTNLNFLFTPKSFRLRKTLYSQSFGDPTSEDPMMNQNYWYYLLDVQVSIEKRLRQQKKVYSQKIE